MPRTIAAAPPRLRPDLVIAEDGPGGTGLVVKDPRAKRFYRFGRVEGFLLARLDGHRSALDLQVAAASELGETLSLDDVFEFIDTLREKGLVEGEGPALPSYRPDLGAQVVAALEAGGVHAAPAAALPAGSHQRHEAEKFEDAIGFLRAGRFHAALSAFDEILLANPRHERAIAIRALLLQAGSKAALDAANAPAAREKQSLLYYRIPLCNPDRLLAALEPRLRFF
ncbi:MAG: hypothetical protein HC882_08905, partial [Acidobacteria bacterium]|nr:hypothetical protein [Acidobacteriota bacterium]